jgi:hypothetical protein
VKPTVTPYLAAAILAGSLVACGGATTEPKPVATIVVPNLAGARTTPGGRLSFEGACANVKLPATHLWDFPGGDPSSSTSIAGVVRFPSGGTVTVSYRCTGADGKPSPTATRTVEVAPPGPSLLTITPQYLSTTAEAALGAAFDDAVSVVTTYVVGPAPGLDGSEPAWSDCGNVPITTHAGEVRVLVSLEPLDGPHGLVALSSPCYIRNSDHLPYIGVMKIDTADVPLLAPQQLRTVLHHELLHVLGFGTLWDQAGLPLLIGGSGSSDPFLAGAQARAAFRDFDGGAGYRDRPVPLDNLGGIGSRERHWRASVFDSELMTAVLGSASPMSRTTLESLADLGWQVEAELADPFHADTTSFGALRTGAAAEAIDLGDDALPIVPKLR